MKEINIGGETLKFYSMQEAAELMGIKYNTVRCYINSGKLPYRHIGRKFWILEDDLKEFIKTGEVKK